MKRGEDVLQGRLIETKSGDTLTSSRGVLSSCKADVIRPVAVVAVLRSHAQEVAVASLAVTAADDALQERPPPQRRLDRSEPSLTELLVDCPELVRLDISVVVARHQHPPGAVRRRGISTAPALFRVSASLRAARSERGRRRSSRRRRDA